MSKPLTYEYVKDYIESFGYILISDTYINIQAKLIVACDKGHVYPVSFGNFKNGKRCPVCAKKNAGFQRRLDYDDVKNKIEADGALKVLSTEYQNNSSPLKIICKHGHIFNKSYASLQRNMVCPKCAKNNMAKMFAFTYDEVKTYVENQGYKMLSQTYKNVGEKICVQCPCGNIYTTKYNNFRSGRRCNICSMKKAGYDKRLTFDCVKQRIENIEGYQLLSDKYATSSQKLTIQCPEGHIFYCSINKFSLGQRCPICQKSKGETKIKTYLDTLNIVHKPQYSFDDCRNIEPLRFDFAIFANTEQCYPILLIEYDGEFHYEPILGRSQLKYQQKLDSIKNNYCQNNNIPLLRIPYWEFDNIEQILSDQLQKYNLLEK